MKLRERSQAGIIGRYWKEEKQGENNVIIF